MKLSFPTAPESYSRTFANLLLATLQRGFAMAVSKDEETHRVILR